MLPVTTATALPVGGGSGFTIGAAVLAVVAVGAYELARRETASSPVRSLFSE